MGHYENGNRGINAPGDVARYLNEGDLDMIVGGHSQEPVCMEGPNVIKRTLNRVMSVSQTNKTVLTLFRRMSGVNMLAVPITNSVTANYQW